MDFKKSFRSLGLVSLLFGSPSCSCLNYENNQQPKVASPFQDVDGDGKVDFVYCAITGKDNQRNTLYSLFVKYNNGDKTFGEAQALVENTSGFPGYCPEMFQGW